MLYNVWQVLAIILIFRISTLFSSINQAPTKVNVRLQVSRLNQLFEKGSKLKVCVAKIKERCFWSMNKELTWNGEQYQEILFEFAMNNMAVDITFEVIIENKHQKIEFSTKTINLMKFNSKDSFEIMAFNLDSLVTVVIEHECENGYFPPGQCSQQCYKVPNESDCDAFGNKICKEGLFYDSNLDRCIINNCSEKIQCGKGHCVSKVSGFECECLPNFYGKFCQFRNPCASNPCYNGGTCKSDFNSQSFKCFCLPRFTDDRCLTKIKEKCSCPENMKCKYSKSGSFESCQQDVAPIIHGISPINSPSKRNLRSEWGKVSLNTTVIAAVGCFMFLMCVGVSLYIFCQTRSAQNTKRNQSSGTSPSAKYAEMTPMSTEESFKRSFSMDDNSVYMPGNSQAFQMIPSSCQTGLNNEYYLNRNLYQEFPPTSLRNFPVFDGFNFPREYPLTPLILHSNHIRDGSSSPISCNSLKTPPHLPPRSNTTEMTSSATSATKDTVPSLLSNSRYTNAI